MSFAMGHGTLNSGSERNSAFVSSPVKSQDIVLLHAPVVFEMFAISRLHQDLLKSSKCRPSSATCELAGSFS